MKMLRRWILRLLRDLFDKELSELCRAAETVVSAGKGLVEAHHKTVDAMQPLRDAINTLEGAGIRRKFGGVIDIDYDKMLTALGPDGERELADTIKKRTKSRPKGKGPTAKAVAA